MFSRVIVTLGIIGTLIFAMGGCRKSQPKTPPEGDAVKTATEFAAEAEDEITEENLDEELDSLEKEIDSDIANEE